MLAIINKAAREGKLGGSHIDNVYEDIPNFNDETGMTFTKVAKILDLALEVLKPHAAMVFIADEEMTDAEKKAQNKALWKIEDQMWDEYTAKYSVHQDKKGTWRTKNGKFAKVPDWMRYRTRPKGKDQETLEQREFRWWLDDHEKRGWDTFWDELAACKDDEKCKDRLIDLTDCGEDREDCQEVLIGAYS